MPVPAFSELVRQLTAVGRRFDQRGWVSGTSGNFSAVVSVTPLRLAITPSGAWKGELAAEEILEVDECCAVVTGGDRKPSAESPLHVEIVRQRGAGAVLHTHSIWSTVLSERHAPGSGLEITGYEMLKGLTGVTSHLHREWIPILENDQDMDLLSRAVRQTLTSHPDCHGFLLRRHGLYTWGETLTEAVRHVEILEFLLEAVGRSEEWRDHGGHQDPR
jgi:methylthioribulose-1-phosphate dehydratase